MMGSSPPFRLAARTALPTRLGTLPREDREKVVGGNTARVCPSIEENMGEMLDMAAVQHLVSWRRGHRRRSDASQDRRGIYHWTAGKRR